MRCPECTFGGRASGAWDNGFGVQVGHYDFDPQNIHPNPRLMDWGCVAACPDLLHEETDGAGRAWRIEARTEGTFSVRRVRGRTIP